MLLVQLAFDFGRRSTHRPAGRGGLVGSGCSLDVYIALGTAFFAWAMWSHPRLGRGFAISGILLAVLLLAFNLFSFPEPPGENNLIDLGPFVGLWYLAVTIQMWRSLSWVRQALAAF